MQASNFGGTFDQLFLWIFYETFKEDASTFSIPWWKKEKHNQKLKSRGPALNFLFVWKVLEKYENDTTFVRMRSSDHLGDAKMLKKALRFVEFNFFTNRNRRKRFLQNERRREDLQKVASIFLIFAWGLSYGLSKFTDDFSQLCRLWKTITKSLGLGKN